LQFLTKAVHIEVVTSLTIEAFLPALRHFIAWRGKPRTIYSDNGTNFQGTSNQLREVYTMLQFSSQMARLQDFLTTEGCDWNFIPPHAPHFGGLWEAAVKSMKHHLRRTLGPHIPTYEQLYTLLTEKEACLNSRPLCALTSDPFNQTRLSPGHFLIGEPLTAQGSKIKSLNPLPLLFNSLLHGQKDCVFFSGHLNLRATPETGLPFRKRIS